MALVIVPVVPDKADEALAMFKEHPMGIKYTLGFKGAVSFDFGLETPSSSSSEEEDGSTSPTTATNIVIFQHWREVADYTAYIATRRADERMKDWDAAFGPYVAGPMTIKWFPSVYAVSN